MVNVVHLDAVEGGAVAWGGVLGQRPRSGADNRRWTATAHAFKGLHHRLCGVGNRTFQRYTNEVETQVFGPVDDLRRQAFVFQIGGEIGQRSGDLDIFRITLVVLNPGLVSPDGGLLPHRIVSVSWSGSETASIVCSLVWEVNVVVSE